MQFTINHIVAEWIFKSIYFDILGTLSNLRYLRLGVQPCCVSSVSVVLKVVR